MSLKNDKTADNLLKLIAAHWPQGGSVPSEITKAIATMKEENSRYALVWPEAEVIEELTNTVGLGFLPYLVEEANSHIFSTNFVNNPVGLNSSSKEAQILLGARDSDSITNPLTSTQEPEQVSYEDDIDDTDDDLSDLDFAQMLDNQKSQQRDNQDNFADFQKDEPDNVIDITNTLEKERADPLYPEGVDNFSQHEDLSQERKIEYRVRPQLSNTHSMIEGDSYHTLKLLQATHTEKIDWVYIDAPSSNDLIYSHSTKAFDDSYRQSKWLSFMKKRLLLSAKLMSEEGIVFLSVEEYDLAPLRLLCDEVWGNSNFLSMITWRKNRSYKARQIAQVSGYILAYAKNKSLCRLDNQDLQKDLQNLVSDQKLTNKAQDNLNAAYFTNFWGAKITATQQEARSELKNLFNIVNTNTNNSKTTETDITVLNSLIDKIDIKPVSLMRHLLRIAAPNNSVCLDLFGGSGTTAEAVLRQYEEDKKSRQLIMGIHSLDDHILLARARLNSVVQELEAERNKKPQPTIATEILEPLRLQHYSIAFMSYDETTLLAQSEYAKCLENLVLIAENLSAHELVEQDENYTLYQQVNLQANSLDTENVGVQDNMKSDLLQLKKVIFIHNPDDFLSALSDYIEDYEEEEDNSDLKVNTTSKAFSATQVAMKKIHTQRQEKYKSLIDNQTHIYLFNYFKNNRFDAENSALLVEEFNSKYPHSALNIMPKDMINRITRS